MKLLSKIGQYLISVTGGKQFYYSTLLNPQSHRKRRKIANWSRQELQTAWKTVSYTHLEEREARVEAEKKNAILMHVNKTYTMTEIAKELGLKSAIELNKILAEKKIQYKVNGTWVMYSQYSNLGYEEIKQEVLDSGRVVYHRRITQLGRSFILEVIGENFEKELA